MNLTQDTVTETRFDNRKKGTPSPSAFLRSFALLIMALLGGFALTAGGDWGGDDGSDGGGGYQPAGSWHTIYPSGGQSAWSKYDDLIQQAWGNSGAGFLRGSGYDSGRNMSEEEIAVCMDAEFIWYYSNAPNGNNHIIANENTHNALLPTRSGADNHRGREASGEEWDAWLNNGTDMYPQWYEGRMSIICASDAWLDSTERGTARWTASNTFSDTETYSRSCERAFTQIGVDKGFDDEAALVEAGGTAINNQSRTESRACGDLFNKMNNSSYDEDRLRDAIGNSLYNSIDGNSPSSADIRNAADRASNSSDDDFAVELNDNNQEAVSSGNIANITMDNRDVTIDWRNDKTASGSTTTYCEYFYEPTGNGGIDDIVEVNCDPDSTPNNSGPTGSNSGLTSSNSRCDLGSWSNSSTSSGERNALSSYLGNNCPQIGVNNINNPGSWGSDWNNNITTGGEAHSFETDVFYQIMGVTCNAEGFNDAMDASSNPSIQTGNGATENDPRFTGIAYSSKITGNDAENGAANREWGNSNHSNPALAATGSANFFTKECVFVGVCEVDNDHTHAVNPSEDESFGSIENAINGERNGEPEQAFGPGSNGSGASDKDSLAFTRDNDGDLIELQVSAPVVNGPSSSVVSVGNNGRPVNTLVSRWSGGTPGVGDEGGKFSMQPIDRDGSMVGNAFGSNNGTAEIVNTEAPEGFASENMRMYEGGYNKFDVRANWYSNSDSPEIVNVSWGYDVGINSTFHTGIRPGADGNDRFATNANGSTRSLDEVVTTHYGRCQAGFDNEGGGTDYTEHLENNTGTGVEYVEPQQDSEREWDSDSDTPYDLKIEFLRNVSER